MYSVKNSKTKKNEPKTIDLKYIIDEKPQIDIVVGFLKNTAYSYSKEQDEFINEDEFEETTKSKKK